MRKEGMTPRERLQAVLNRKTPDRVPMDFWGTPEVLQGLKKHLGVSSDRQVWEKLHIDRLVTIAPEYSGPALPADTNYWGCRFRDVDYGSGAYQEVEYGPLAQYETVEEIKKKHVWPDPDSWNYSNVQKLADDWAPYPIRIFGSEPFLMYKNMRGEAQAFMDLALNPEIVEYCLDRMYGLRYIEVQRMFEAVRPGTIQLVMVAEDMGSQTSLLYSPDHIRRFFVPHFKRMMKLAHEGGAKVIFHSDGAVRPLIPMLIDCGVDMLNPIQWRCPGMERGGLKADFGDRLMFHGGVDNQQTLPFGTAEEVRREVAENLQILGQGGGYVLAPCHNIQPVSPVENILALYETGLEQGLR